MSHLSDNIWFTRKARIQASERLYMNSHHAQLILILYSLSNVAYAIAALKYENFLNGESDIALIIMSIGILVISLFITNIDFKGRAESFKENYLKLQLLYEKTLKSNDDFSGEYVQLLRECENHKPIDDKFFRVTNRSSLTNRKPTIIDWIEVVFYIFCRKAILIILYATPILLPILLKI